MREQVITANDLLRTQGNGGQILMTPAVWELDPQLRGRALYRLTLYDAFDHESLHDYGLFIFAGFTFVWEIGVFAGQRSLTLSLAHEWFGAEHCLPWNRKENADG